MTKTSESVLLGLWFLSGTCGLWAQPTITEYSVPAAASSPTSITAGPDGNLWFTEGGANKIAKITTSGTITEYAIPTGNSRPWTITAGSDGNLWFTEIAGNKIGKITTNGVITEYLIPTASAGPSGIAAGPDGNLWFTESEAAKVGKITTSGIFTEYSISGPAFPAGIAAGPDGNLWFTEGANKVGRISTAGGITEYPVVVGIAATPSLGSDAITQGPDGNLWFTGYGSIWRITTGGAVTAYSAPSGIAQFPGIALGPDGNLWFTDTTANQVGKLTTGGTFAEYSIPTGNSQPGGIVAGPDGNLWFTETAGNKIAKLVLSTVPVNNLLTFSPSSLTFTGASGGSPPPSQTLSVTATASTAYTASASVVISFGPPWLSISPSGNLTGNQTITVSVNQYQMGTYGAYSGSISLVSGDVKQIIPVTLNITAPPTGGNVSVTPGSLSFNYISGTSPPEPQYLTIMSATQGVAYIPVTVSASIASPAGGSWLTLTTGNGNAIPNGSSMTSGSGIFAAVNPATLSAGTYNASITITPSGGAVVTVPVTLTVTVSATPLIAAPASLTFQLLAGAPKPPTQMVRVTEKIGTSQPFAAAIKRGSSWLSITPRADYPPAWLVVSVVTAGLAAGTYTDSIVLSLSQGDPAPPASIPVSLVILPNAFTEYPIPAAHSSPGAIAQGADGNLWFTEYDGTTGKIGKITPSGTITEYPIPTAYSSPLGITPGPDGSIWFTEAWGKTGKITPDGKITEYGAANLAAQAIVLGPDGNLWFTAAGFIGKITTGGVVTTYFTRSFSAIYAIAVGPDGNLWFTEYNNNKIGKITPSGTITEFNIPTMASQPMGITQGPDGNLWFTEASANQIGKITTTGTITEYSIGSMTSPSGITLGPDGNLWFAEQGAIGEIAPSGEITQYPNSDFGQISYLTPGPDGNLWFTENTKAKIGKLVIAPPPPSISAVVNAASFAGGVSAPGEIVSIFGTSLGPSNPLGLTLNSVGKVATSLGGVSVTFNGYAAPLTYVSATQINCVVPYETGVSSLGAGAQVTFANQASPVYSLRAADATPGIFTLNGSGTGPGAIINGSGSVNGLASPASPGSTITFFVTGEGQTVPAGVTGGVTTANTSSNGPLTPQPQAALSVTIGGKPATVTYYGEAPGFVAGIMQVNAQIPNGVASGNLPLMVALGSAQSQSGVTVSVQ